jgi:hypothetical protein
MSITATRSSHNVRQSFFSHSALVRPVTNVDLRITELIPSKKHFAVSPGITVVRHTEAEEFLTWFYTQFKARVFSGNTIADLEHEFLPYMPVVLHWVKTMEVSEGVADSVEFFEKLNKEEPDLWVAYRDSEEYILEIVDYVGVQLEYNEDRVSDEYKESMNDLYLRRLLYRFILISMYSELISLPNDQHSYLIKQLWRSGHDAAGLIYSLLPEVPETPLFDNNVAIAMSDEDKMWLEDAANDPVI